jgi:Ca2+-binding RTX toxin-like protein
MRARISIVVSIAVVTLAASASVQAGSACTYDPGTDRVSVIPGGASRTVVFVGPGGEIKASFGDTEFDCGDATTANTTSIVLDASSADEVLRISQNGAGGLFPPTISFVVQAEGGLDFFRLIGSSGPDSFRFGVDPADDGVAPAADLYATGDPRIRLLDVEFLSARMLGGNDSVTGKPGADFDGPLPIALDAAGAGGADIVIGGSDDDRLSGGRGGDTVKGLAGGDVLFGGSGNDDLGGGPGVDDCNPGPGNDRVRGCEG